MFTFYAIRIHLMRVRIFGGLPNIKSPTLNTFAANQRKKSTPTKLIKIASRICHAGGASVDETRIIMMNGEIGGIILMMVENNELGALMTGIKKM